MWGGRFAAGPAAAMRRINASLGVDKRLWRHDIAASRAHAAMLGACGIISPADAAAIDAGLARLAERFEREGPPADAAAHEDIHMAIEALLAVDIGPAAGRLHTARSRNDQVATSFRLWVRAACGRAIDGLLGLARTLVARAEEHAATIMPGFTHLQVAQPITLGHHLMAYVEMARRDADRFRAAAARMDECPLGAAALAGTGFPIDRAMTAAALGFARPTRNSLDSVASRDFALDYLAAAAIAGAQLSRLAEELILWTSQPFGFARLPDAWSTGSSIMPQKRNPDAAELARGKAAGLAAAFTRLAGTLKALPLAYAKDLQDDKATMFAAADEFDLMVEAITGMIATVEFIPARMRALAGTGHATATDLADALVRDAGLPFREAHHVAGRAVAAAEAAGVELAGLDEATLRAVDPRITRAMLMDVDQSVASRTSPGGTAPARVREAIAAARAELGA